MNIVLVDNNLYFLKSMELLLRGRGHTVITFSDPLEALEIIPSVHWHDSNLPVYLVDYLMPQLNGVEFFLRTQSLDRRKFALITGHYEKLEHELKVKELETIQLFSKPLDIDKLFEYIEKDAA